MAHMGIVYIYDEKRVWEDEREICEDRKIVLGTENALDFVHNNRTKCSINNANTRNETNGNYNDEAFCCAQQ